MCAYSLCKSENKTETETQIQLFKPLSKLVLEAKPSLSS